MDRKGKDLKREKIFKVLIHINLQFGSLATVLSVTVSPILTILASLHLPPFLIKIPLPFLFAAFLTVLVITSTMILYFLLPVKSCSQNLETKINWKEILDFIFIFVYL